MTFDELKQRLCDSTLQESDWHQHQNGGGWVANTATVAVTVFLASSSIVYGNAQVSGNARVYGNAQVYGDARVYGNAWVSGDARVYGNAWEHSPLYIQGTLFSLANAKYGHIQIGCTLGTFDWWTSDEAICLAKQNKFTDAQIEEYRAYIELFKKIGK